MLIRRNWLILGVSALTVGSAALSACWVDSNKTAPVQSSSTAGGDGLAGSSGSVSNGAAAGTSAGSTSTVGGESVGGSAPAASGGGTSVAGTGTGGTGPAGGGTSAGGMGTGGTGTGGTGTGGTTGTGTGFPAGCPMPSTTAHQATALDRSCWAATSSDCSTSAANNNPPALALDGMASTRFSTGLKMSAQTAPFTYEADMTTAVMITGVKVDSSVSTDAAPQLEVEVSTDHTTWKAVACGDGMTATDFSFAAVSARWVRVTQYGSAGSGTGSGWWSIHEFYVYGSLGTEKACATAGTGATGASCTKPHAG